MLKKRGGYLKMKLTSVTTTSAKSESSDKKLPEEKMTSKSVYIDETKHHRSDKERNFSAPAYLNKHHFSTTLSPTSVFVDYKDQRKTDQHQKKALLQPKLSSRHRGTSMEEETSPERLVFKNGECNVNRANIKKRRQRYMADIFTTLVDIKWRWNLLNFVLAFMLSWLIFALLWWLIAFSHGDIGGRPDDQRPCVEEVFDFVSALLFSIETQQTIGYGSRHTNAHCPDAILVMMFQSCFGVIIQALMTGLVFAKLSRPKKRAETLLFSKNALICKRDGQMCLVFRVGDMRKSHIVEAHVRAIMIRKRTTQEGEVVPLYQTDLKLGDGETEGRLFMVWPVIVEHRITEESPFWSWSAEDLTKEKFELVVVLEGIVESTGMTTQARTSYLPEEIIWGHRFEKLVTFRKETNQYLIDYSLFHSTVSIDIPKYSAKDLQRFCRDSSDEDSSEYDDDDVIDDDDDDFQAEIMSAASEKLKSKRTEVNSDRLATMKSLLHSNGVAGAALFAFELQHDDETTSLQSITAAQETSSRCKPVI